MDTTTAKAKAPTAPFSWKLTIRKSLRATLFQRLSSICIDARHDNIVDQGYQELDEVHLSALSVSVIMSPVGAKKIE